MTGENFMRINRSSDIKVIKEKILSLQDECGKLYQECRGTGFLMKQNTILYQKKSSGKNIFYGDLEME